jgi:hypothetical protein
MNAQVMIEEPSVEVRSQEVELIPLEIDALAMVGGGEGMVSIR